MTILDGTGESELVQLLNTIEELTKQLARNRSLSVELHKFAEAVKTQATHSKTGFVLRRFNPDKSQDAYDAELERMNSSLAAENQSLLNDNKQLGVLIKEYEQTLESVMGAFRTRARDVQEHELTLIREYEARLLAKESENLLEVLSSTTAESISLGRISATLRSFLRVLNGEDVPSPPCQRASPAGDKSPSDDVDFGKREEEDSALERECELSRLERENAVLRRLLGLDVREADYLTRDEPGGTEPVDQQRLSVPGHNNDGPVSKKRLGGAPGTVGPYGTYKRSGGRTG